MFPESPKIGENSYFVILYFDMLLFKINQVETYLEENCLIDMSEACESLILPIFPSPLLES